MTDISKPKRITALLNVRNNRIAETISESIVYSKN